VRRSAVGLTLERNESTTAERRTMERIRTERYDTTAWVVERQGPRP